MAIPLDGRPAAQGNLRNDFILELAEGVSWCQHPRNHMLNLPCPLAVMKVPIPYRLEHQCLLLGPAMGIPLFRLLPVLLESLVPLLHPDIRNTNP